ncbi:MAG: hypothetical protein JWR80_9325 [Bradyrhizobium sp.]|jgi:hypothetical protein|nr:hypothetical protein [Bradyrhizobium sp.]
MRDWAVVADLPTLPDEVGSRVLLDGRPDLVMELRPDPGEIGYFAM